MIPATHESCAIQVANGVYRYTGDRIRAIRTTGEVVQYRFLARRVNLENGSVTEAAATVCSSIQVTLGILNQRGPRSVTVGGTDEIVNHGQWQGTKRFGGANQK
jgi:hypothetical protein